VILQYSGNKEGMADPAAKLLFGDDDAEAGVARDFSDDNFIEAGFFAGIGPLLKRDAVFALIEDVLFAVIEQPYECIQIFDPQSRYPLLLEDLDNAFKPVNVGVAAGCVHIDFADYKGAARLENPVYLFQKVQFFFKMMKRYGRDHNVKRIGRELQGIGVHQPANNLFIQFELFDFVLEDRHHFFGIINRSNKAFRGQQEFQTEKSRAAADIQHLVVSLHRGIFHHQIQQGTMKIKPAQSPVILI
jgi:hypothetical protein